MRNNSSMSMLSTTLQCLFLVIGFADFDSDFISMIFEYIETHFADSHIVVFYDESSSCFIAVVGNLFSISAALVPSPFGNPAWAMTVPSFHQTANCSQSFLFISNAQLIVFYVHFFSLLCNHLQLRLIPFLRRFLKSDRLDMRWLCPLKNKYWLLPAPFPFSLASFSISRRTVFQYADSGILYRMATAISLFSLSETSPAAPCHSI